jgi:eukaryotic-like serine/threonine-protein kinase
MSMLSAGSVVAGYRIERLLGSGGMGAVYLAANPNLPRYDALKVLSPALSGNAEFRARFIREADVAARLDHPNSVSIYDRGQTEAGQLWIAMQFVDGTDADKALRAGAMTPARAVYIVGQIAKALDYAHQHGVVHRDIKPANFLLTGPVGPDERVLLGDFGIARALGGAGSTVTGSGMTTLSYAAPEVLAGGPVDTRADLYSLGCTLFRLLTGKTPFAWAQGIPALVAAQLNAPPPKVTEQTRGLSARMDSVIATAMAKHPLQRFSSARQLAAAAAEALSDETTPTTAVWQPVPGEQVTSYSPSMPLTGPSWVQPGAPPTMVAPTPPPGYPVGPPRPGMYPLPLVRRRRAGRIAGAVAVAVVVAAAVATTVALSARSHPQHAASGSPSASSTASSGSPSSRPPAATAATGPAPPAATSSLSGFLLSTQEVAGIFGVATTRVTSTSANGLTDDTPYISEKDCTGPYAPADAGAYDHVTTKLASQLQILQDPDGPDAGTQMVMAFPSADAAQTVLAEQRQHWQACAGRTFALTTPNETPKNFTFGPLTTPDGNLAMTFTALGRSSAGCQRALGVRNNIIIDVAASGFNIGNHGLDMLNAIAAKIPQ